jgi:uncharacterized membrane-anchored protein YhcB (DUF1043 family)
MEHHKKNNLGAFLSGVFVATAVGGYFLFGSKNAKKNRQKVQDGVEDAKADMMARLKKIKRLSRDKYCEIVDEVSDKYAEIKEIGKEKADELRQELKSKWEEIEEEAMEEAENE